MKNKSSVTRVVPTYLSLFIFGFLYELWLVYDALRLKNTIQIIGLCIYNVGLLIEAAIQSDQIHDALRVEGGGESVDSDFLAEIHPFVIAVPCIMALGTILMAFVAWKLYDEFAWSIYKNISADLRLKRRFLSYQVCRSLYSMCETVQWNSSLIEMLASRSTLFSLSSTSSSSLPLRSNSLLSCDTRPTQNLGLPSLPFLSR